ncbi:hypothetical protein HCN44_009498 [Aphidius gifuensis]|uniref:Uncharacterized protein n=1 Tax=Aphidius gifuensis TaxID=684658 RepID=A0A834Y2D2_APHGI|nr:receptor-interacting serine/threonine-protein kinase 4-like [Aphidius gifuensis]KAF7998100.1 hypothetical protein HCN44_009498 [Aphidius gifuensis]
MLKEPNSSVSSESSLNDKLNIEKLNISTVDDDLSIETSSSSSNVLNIYLENQNICNWEENYETQSSIESLGSPELISEAGTNTSSGYNSCGNEGIIKSKRDSDTQSSSSTSDSVDLNTSTYKNNKTSNLNNSNNAKKIIIIKEKKKYYDPDDGEKFHKAVRNGDTAVVVELVENGLVQDLNEPDWNVSGDPPLLVAATNHHLSILSLLLANGCDPGARSPRGETALHRAITNGHIGDTHKFVEELLNYGCSAGVKEAGGGLTALHMLTKQLSHAQTLRGLLKNDFDEALKTFELLAKAGAVNDKDHQGRSALHILASSTAFDNNHRQKVESLVKILLDCGADTTLKNDRGETPLHEALEFGALNTADILISKTPTGLISRYGESPLHIAAKKNHTEIVDKLLKHGENSSLQNTEGNSPLHLASARGFHQIVSLLLTSSLNDIEQLNDDGLTALQVAAESGFANTVKVLINSGADPSVIDCTSTVIQHRHPDISKIIHNELTRRQQLAT